MFLTGGGMMGMSGNSDPATYPKTSPVKRASPEQKTEPERGLPLRGDIAPLHDPVMTREGDTYYLFTTGNGITVSTSKDKINWKQQGRVFSKPLPWTSATIPGFKDHYWAPDISFWKGSWHLYYSVSTFGKNHSVIGLATNVTLDPNRKDYDWKDKGLVIESQQGGDWNAIDPNLILDEKKNPWLVLGSFWSGIKLVKLDPATGKPAKPKHSPEKDAPLLSLATRPATPDIRGAIEAPFLFRHGNFYYLFVSFDFCCRGVNSTYNVRVGRSAKITGPYLDREGKAMLEGGGTPVVSGSGRWRGTGHNAVYREKNTDWIIYHAYDAEQNGVPTLRIEKLEWDKRGWPLASKAALP